MTISSRIIIGIKCKIDLSVDPFREKIQLNSKESFAKPGFSPERSRNCKCIQLNKKNLLTWDCWMKFNEILNNSPTAVVWTLICIRLGLKLEVISTDFEIVRKLQILSA